MANVKALEKSPKSSKGTPEKRGQSINVIESDTRAKDGKNKVLQLSVPPQVFDDFSMKAAEMFGARKGCKQELFLEMWARFNNTK